MAQRPDGKPARTERVTFTRPAAERIAKVVRHVEAGDRDCGPLRFGRAAGGNVPSKLLLGTFTGNWETASWTTVTLLQSTQTVEVYNWCNPAVGGDTVSTAQTRWVVFGKVGGSEWKPGTPNNAAVELQYRPTPCRANSLTIHSLDLATLPGYDPSVIQLLGHEAKDDEGQCSGGFQWYSITTCSTSTAA